MIIEVSRKKVNELGLENAVKEGFFTEWTSDKIKDAFNLGNGTLKDFREYAKNNKRNCVFLEK